MIEIIYPDKPAEIRQGPLSFAELKALVGGYVQMVAIREDGTNAISHVCMNEDGFQMALPENLAATRRFRGKINIGPAAVGTWVILTGKDLLK